ncbi:unnamed protein product [Mytilus edulis]|uniref:Uncharacterized protein n=1 Tax=Mytilus edulis TaxID=6550 RepID=A0A8S3QAX4_MYTED|nr:unnamed protein product [Mytilus edulis]
MDDLTFGEKLKRALNTDDAEELLRLCCDSSKRKDILDFEDDAGHCLLHRVSGSGTVDVMRTLMNMGADENEDVCNEFETWLQTACSHDGRTALLMLVKNNDPKGVDILCQCGADVNVGTIYRSGFKAIHIAARGFRDCAEMIQILLKYGANVNEPLIRNNLNQQPLFMALKAGNERNARVLFEHGADISFKGETSETPEDTIGCFCLAIKQCPALVPDFIKRGANLYERHNKKSVLMIALDIWKRWQNVIQCCKHYVQLKSFRNAGISVHEMESTYKVPTLGLSLSTWLSYNICTVRRSDLEIENGELELIKNEVADLVLNGANPDMSTEEYDLPLITAVKNRLQGVFEILIAAGANIHQLGKDGNSAVHVCCIGPNPNSIDTLKILIENGMPLNKPNLAGKYPLELLIDKNRDCTYFLLLLSNGADPNIISKGNFVLIRAVNLRMYDVCIALLDANADIGRTDEDGFTAFDILASQLKELSSLYHPRKYQGSAVKLFETFVLAGIDVNQQNMFGTYPLFLAISLGAEGVVKVILEKGADVNIVNDNGKTPLFESIFHELDDIVKVLLHAGANVNQICNVKTEHHAGNGREQQTEMSILAKLLDNKQMSLEKRRYFVSLLLEFGADPNLEKSGKDSCLMLAVHHGDPTMVKTLLEAHADINHIGNKGYTALHVFFLNINKSGAYIDESFEDESSVPESGTPSNVSFILKILLEYGAHTDVSSLDGNLPIHIALSNCKTCYDFESNLGDIMKLIDLTKDINIQDKNRSTPFLDITKFCSLDVMKKMVELGADLKSKGTNGKTALHVVIEKKMFSRDIFSFLLINGADINAINDLEETPLISCIKRGSTYASVENIVFLLENGAKANLCADESNSALLDAILFESFNVASVLIDHQANLNHIGENGNTVLHAVFSKALEVVEKLVDAGACLNIANKDGKTPLCCLIENQSKETIETVLPYLLEKGSDPNFGEALPLIAAAYLNQQRTTTMLLEHGANVDGMNSQGNTALTTILNDYCDSTKGSREGIVDILLKGGASVTLTDGNGKPPLLLLINSVKQSGNYCYGYTNWDKLVSQTALKLIDKEQTQKLHHLVKILR